MNDDNQHLQELLPVIKEFAQILLSEEFEHLVEMRNEDIAVLNKLCIAFSKLAQRVEKLENANKGVAVSVDLSGFLKQLGEILEKD